MISTFLLTKLCYHNLFELESFVKQSVRLFGGDLVPVLPSALVCASYSKVVYCRCQAQLRVGPYFSDPSPLLCLLCFCACFAFVLALLLCLLCFCACFCFLLCFCACFAFVLALLFSCLLCFRACFAFVLALLSCLLCFRACFAFVLALLSCLLFFRTCFARFVLACSVVACKAFYRRRTLLALLTFANRLICSALDLQCLCFWKL